MSTLKRGRKPTEPEPCFRWIDDECAGITCGCGAEMSVSTNWPLRCPSCGRIYQLQQRNWIEERDSSSVKRCAFCGGVRCDDGTYCPECQRDAEGQTFQERQKAYLDDLDRKLREKEST